ncbi:trypsin-like serine peptidase [Amphritea japonica]|uniref:Peptidase S1 domain-containing protein n=1 Tax=Amphritea japonica ATCC BAA-1530 TaxID=1278309 RepID=A0A7R6P979_9GAMM|nr:trypsin-like serine protease [Amphritea japonica]BBB25163.1 conserved hypothetical protein [Amphritea japonica ATCC BAA-1530]
MTLIPATLLLICCTGLAYNQCSYAAEDVKDGSAWQTIAPTSYPMQRKWVSSEAHPWRMIGRINLAGRGHCTATLVSANQALTSAHCLWNSNTGKWFPAQYITFVAGAEKDTFQGLSTASGYTIAPDFNPHTLNSAELIKHDWALLTLNKPLGTLLGHLPLAAEHMMTIGQEISQAGYRADRPYVLTVEDRCSITQAYENRAILRTNCNTLEGDSGGPVLVKQNKQWVLMGIHRGRTINNQSLVISANNFSEFITGN